MSDLAENYAIPPDLAALVDDGFLEVLREDETTKTVEFHIPSRRRRDEWGRITSYSLAWIHPDFNAQHCRYYVEHPGDAPNFHVTEDITDVGDESIDLESVDDQVAWLEGLRAAAD